MSAVPTLNINVVAAETGLDALRLKIQGISSAVAGLNVNSPLEALRQKMFKDVASIKETLQNGLTSAFAGGAQGVSKGSSEILDAIKFSNAQMREVVQQGQEALEKKIAEGSARSSANRQKTLAQLKKDNDDQQSVASERKVIQREFEENNAKHTDTLSAEDLRRHKLRGGALFADQRLELDREALDQKTLKREAKFSEMSARQQLQQVRGVAAELRKGVSPENIAKSFAPSAVAGVSDLESFVKRAEDFRVANKKIVDTSASDAKKANDLLQSQRDKNRAFEKLDAEKRLELAEQVAASRKALNSEQFIAKKYAPLAIEAANDLPATRQRAEEFKAAEESRKRLKGIEDDKLRELVRGGKDRLAQIERNAAEEQKTLKREAKFSEMSARQQLQQVRGVAAELRKGVSPENIAKSFAPSAVAGVSDLESFVKRAEDFRVANKKIVDTSASDAKKANDLLQSQRDKNRAFEKLDAEKRLELAEQVAASRKALNSEQFIAKKYAPLAIEAAGDLPAMRQRAEEFKAAEESRKRLKGIEDDKLRDLQRGGKERLAQIERNAAEESALQKAADANAVKNGAFSRSTPASKLATGNKIAGALEFGASDESIVKKHGTAALEAAKNLSALEAATLKTSPAMKGLTLDMNDAHAAARGLAGGFGQLWLTYGNLAPLLAGAAVSAGFVAIIKLGAQVQNTFATIGALSEETTESVRGLNAQMLEMARTGPYGPKEISEAMKTLSLAGLNAKEVSQSIGDVLRFSIAGDTDIQTSADVLTTVGVAFKMTADSYGYISDVIAKAAAISKSSVESIGSAFKTASVINSQYGASLEDVGLGLAFLANSGIQRTAAGTALRNFYVDILGRTPKVRNELEAMAKSIGVTSIAMDEATGKALPLVQILKNLNEAYKLKTPAQEYKSKQDVFSERGGKTPFPLLDALNAAVKESGSTVDNFLEESMAKIENAAGFAAIAAAKMALTPLNQMKSVSSSLQATIVETFDSIAPQIIATTSLLKEAFNSDEFKRGLVLAASALADLTVFMVKHADTVVILGSAYLGLQVALGVEALFVALTSRVAAAGIAMGSYARTTAAAAATTAGAVAPTLALAGAQQTLGGASAGLAAAKAVAVTRTAALFSGMSVLLGVVSKIALPLTLVWGAWELYSYWANKSTKTNTDGDSPRQALIKSLETEAKRIEDVNRAKLLGISYDELIQQGKVKATLSASSDKLSIAQAEYDKALKAKEAYSSKGSSGNPVSAERAVKKYQELVDQKKQLLDLASKQDREENVMVRNASAQVAAGHQAAKNQAKQLAKELAAADAARKKASDTSAEDPEAKAEEGVRVARVAYDRLMTEANAYYNNHKKTLDESFRHEQEIIKAKTSARLISEGEGYVQSLSNTLNYEEQQSDLIKKAYADRMFELDKVNDAFKGNFKEYDQFLEQRLKEEGKAQDAYNETTKQLAAATRQRKELASIALSKVFSDDAEELRKLSLEVGAYSEGLKIKAEADLLAAGMSPSERAGHEARAAYTDKFLQKLEAANVALAKQEALISGLQKDYDSFDNRDVQGPARSDIGKELSARVNALVESRKALSELSGTVATGAEQAGAQASAKTLVAEYDKANQEIKDKLSSAIFDAATSGGKGLKDQLKKAILDFSRDKFKLVMDVILNPVSKALTAFLSPEAAQAAGVTSGGGGVGDILSTGKGIYDAISGGFTKLGSTVTGQFANFATSSVGQSMGLSTSSLTGLGGREMLTTTMTQSASSMATAAGSIASAAGGIAAGVGIGSAIAGDKRVLGLSGTASSAIGTAAGFAIGAQIGMIGGPLGAAIGGALAGAVTAAFGMGPKNTTAEGLSGKFGASTGADVQTYSSWRQKGGWFRRDKSDTDYAPVQEALDKFLDLSIVAIASKAKAYAAAVGASSEAVTNYTEDINVSLKGLTTEEQNKALEKAVQTFSDNLALQVEGLSKYVREGESASAVLANMANSLSAVNAAFGLVNLTLFDATLVGAEAASKMLTAFGGVEKFSSGLNSYYENYFTAEEKRANTIKAITKTLNAAGGNFTEGVVGSASREDFRSIFEKKGNTDEFLAAMVSVESAFASITQPIGSVKTALSELFLTLSKESANLQADLMEAKGNKQGAATARTNLETSDYSEAEKSLYLYNLGLKEQIKVATEAQSLQERLYAATDTLAQAADRARQAVDPLNQALYDSAVAAEKAKEVAAEAKGLQDQLNAARDTEAEALERQRNAVNAGNRTLFDQLQIATKGKEAEQERIGLQKELNALTDTATEALKRQRDALNESNRALFDQVRAATAAAAFKEGLPSTVAKYNTPQVNNQAQYVSIANQVKAAGFARADYNELADDLKKASKDDIKKVIQTLFDGLDPLAPKVAEARLALMGFANQLADLKDAEAAAPALTLGDAVKRAGAAVKTFEQIVQERISLEDQLNAATDTTAGALKRQRDALDASNQALFDQVQLALNAKKAAEERLALEARLFAATDTAAKAAERLRLAVDPLNRTFYDTVIAAEKALEQANIRKGLERQLLELQKDQAALRMLDIEGMNAANIALYDRIQAMKTAKETAEKGLTDAFSAVQRAVEAQKKITQAARDAAAEAVTEITSVFDVLKSSVKELYGSVDSTAKMQADQGRAFITQALATAKATGYLPESKALTEAINAAKGGTEEFATQFEKDFATLTLAGDLSELEMFAKTQLTAAEQALKYQESQLEKLDGVLALAQQQLDAANGVNTSVLSLKDALAAFAAALSAQTAITTKVVTTGSDTKTNPVTIASLIAGINTTNPGYSNFIGKASDYSGATVDQFRAIVRGAGIPGFASGINRVPQDMLARIHKDEAVIPSSFNPFNPNAKTNNSGGSDRLEALVVVLIEKVQRLEVVGTEGNVQQRRTAEILNDVTEGGTNMRTLAT